MHRLGPERQRKVYACARTGTDRRPLLTGKTGDFKSAACGNPAACGLFFTTADSTRAQWALKPGEPAAGCGTPLSAGSGRRIKALLRTPAAAPARYGGGRLGFFLLVDQGSARQNSERQAIMSIAKKIAHQFEALKGGAKKRTGRLTGSRRLRAVGRADQAKGNLKQVGAKVKDAFRR